MTLEKKSPLIQASEVIALTFVIFGNWDTIIRTQQGLPFFITIHNFPGFLIIIG